MPRRYEAPCGLAGAWVLCLSCVASTVAIGLYLVREQWDMLVTAIALNVAFVVYYVLWRICGWSCSKVKRAMHEVQKQRRRKKEALLFDENEEFERSITDTIPLL